MIAKRTRVYRIDAENPDLSKIREAAGVLRKGGLVAFPTETVYGLGADAFNPRAVKAIFEAKGRPADNPLIVHIADMSELRKVALTVPPAAERLMAAFWPGPLTLVFQRRPEVPDATTGSLSTVGVRMPDDGVALALISEAGVPVAAPSANVSGSPSPTSGEHVIQDLSGRVDVILDSGPTGVGIESTVLDVTTRPPRLLRPGGVTLEALREVAGTIEVDPSVTGRGAPGEAPRSPGMKYRHYAPKAPLILVEGKSAAQIAARAGRLVDELEASGHRVGVLATRETASYYRRGDVVVVGSRQDPVTIAANLFSCLRAFDSRGVDRIVAEGIEPAGLGFAIMNRLRRAAEHSIVEAEED